MSSGPLDSSSSATSLSSPPALTSPHGSAPSPPPPPPLASFSSSSASLFLSSSSSFTSTNSFFCPSGGRRRAAAVFRRTRPFSPECRILFHQKINATSRVLGMSSSSQRSLREMGGASTPIKTLLLFLLFVRGEENKMKENRTSTSVGGNSQSAFRGMFPCVTCC